MGDGRCLLINYEVTVAGVYGFFPSLMISINDHLMILGSRLTLQTSKITDNDRVKVLHLVVPTLLSCFRIS